MTYFIVEAPYEKCFDIFFKDELGYPNFYRMPELIPLQEYAHLTLVAPYQCKKPSTLENIVAKMNSLNLKWIQFGQDIETVFNFDPQGKLNPPSHFEEALLRALDEYLQLNTEPTLLKVSSA